MTHIIEIKTCHPKRHVKHHQYWWGRCHCGCGWYGEPSYSQYSIEYEALALIQVDGGIISRASGVHILPELDTSSS